jgi:AraC-like DNA-binding protein
MKSRHINFSNSDEEIIKAGVVDNFCNYFHHHKEMQITYLVNAEGNFFVEDYKGNFKSGDIIIIGSNQTHFFNDRLADDSRSTGIKMYSVFLDLEQFQNYFAHIPEFQYLLRTLKKFNSGAKISEELKINLANFIIQSAECSDSERLICFFNLIKAMEEIKEYEVLNVNNLSLPTTGFDNQRLERVILFTKENLHRAIKLEEAADLAFLTPESFCKYFKSKTGKTYIQYVNEMRVNQASKFLMQEKFNLSEICSKVGFSNIS